MKALILSTILLSLAILVSSKGLCPEEDSAVEVLLKNSEDCSTYYQCSNGEAILMPCPHGLHWNDAAKLCDYPDQSYCGISEIKRNSISFDAAPWIPERIKKRCERSPTGTKLADPEDCAGFYVCVNTLPVLQTCIGGLLYNDNLQVCDWPENVDCCENGGETPEATALPPMVPTGNPGTSHPNCESGAEFVPNHKDCTTYFQCDHGKPELRKCPDHLHWNQDLGICDHPHNTSCPS